MSTLDIMIRSEDLFIRVVSKERFRGIRPHPPKGEHELIMLGLKIESVNHFSRLARFFWPPKPGFQAAIFNNMFRISANAPVLAIIDECFLLAPELFMYGPCPHRSKLVPLGRMRSRGVSAGLGMHVDCLKFSFWTRFFRKGRLICSIGVDAAVWARPSFTPKSYWSPALRRSASPSLGHGPRSRAGMPVTTGLGTLPESSAPNLPTPFGRCLLIQKEVRIETNQTKRASRHDGFRHAGRGNLMVDPKTGQRVSDIILEGGPEGEGGMDSTTADRSVNSCLRSRRRRSWLTATVCSGTVPFAPKGLRTKDPCGHEIHERCPMLLAGRRDLLQLSRRCSFHGRRNKRREKRVGSAHPRGRNGTTYSIPQPNHPPSQRGGANNRRPGVAPAGNGRQHS